ncbi:hypothetical protein TNCV_1679011 [Trichonephila clavipes]|nr:hypothetical protein TNCV_1679011 [Trichonephila clavipes]
MARQSPVPPKRLITPRAFIVSRYRSIYWALRFKEKGPMINEPVKPLQMSCAPFENANGCVYSRGLEVAQMGQ